MTDVSSLNSLSDPIPLPRTVFDLADSSIRPELVLRVEGARVVFADYALLRADFPQLAWASRPAIDDWLLSNAAVVSAPQAAQEMVNTKIATTGATVTAFRPPLYGRAVVTAAEGGGLLDVKGAGVAPGLTPLNRSHANGLLAHGEALANIAFREVMERIFRRANTGFSTVPEYAVIDLGFDVRDLFGPATPACIQVRRAHRRPVGGVELPLAGSPEQQVKFEIELLLRHYGMTSCSPATSFILDDSSGKLEMRYADKTMPPHSDAQMVSIRKLTRYEGGKLVIEGVNVQLTREASIRPSRATVIDFGHYSVRDRFELPVVSLVRDRLIRWGGALRPGDATFPQPSPKLRLPLAAWGTPDKPDPRYAVPGHPELIWPMPFVLGFELADGFREGTLSGDDVRARLDALLAEVDTIWDGANAEARAGAGE
jgi:hypothetical protein